MGASNPSWRPELKIAFISCLLPASTQRCEKVCCRAIRMIGLTRSPPPANPITAQVLDKDQITALVQDFKGSPIFPIVAVAAFTGARRNEVLGLQCGRENATH